MHQHSHQRSWLRWNAKWQNVNDLLWFHWNRWRKCLLHRSREFFLWARVKSTEKKRHLPNDFVRYTYLFTIQREQINIYRKETTTKQVKQTSLDIKLEIHSVQISSPPIQIAQPSNWNWNNKLNFSFQFLRKPLAARTQIVISNGIFIYIYFALKFGLAFVWDERCCRCGRIGLEVSSKCYFFVFLIFFRPKNQRTSVSVNCITYSAASIQNQHGKNTHTS